jgi:hypothetical protein
MNYNYVKYMHCYGILNVLMHGAFIVILIHFGKIRMLLP